MIIAFVSDAIYPYNKGGKEKRLFEVSTGLVALGHEVHIYCMKWWADPEMDRVENGVHLHAISKLYPLYSGERRSIKEGILFALACFKLFRIKFDVIDVDHMPFFPVYSVWLVCLLRRKPMYATWLEVWGRKYWVEYMGASGNIAALIEKIAVKLPSKIIAISSYTAKHLDIDLHRSKNVFVVECGIDYEHIQNIKASENTQDIIYTGRLLKHKNVDLLVRAVNNLSKTYPSISCTIIGNGPEKKNLVALSQDLKLQNNIKFLDFLPEHDDVYANIKSSKVFVLASEREGFGIVTIEANACNVPVVTINAPANASRTLIIEGITGTVVEPTAEGIEQGVATWLSKNKSDAIAQHVAKYNWNDITKNIEKAYVS